MLTLHKLSHLNLIRPLSIGAIAALSLIAAGCGSDYSDSYTLYGSYTLTGTVTDSLRQPIAGAEVKVANVDIGNLSATATTDSLGRYSVVSDRGTDHLFVEVAAHNYSNYSTIIEANYTNPVPEHTRGHADLHLDVMLKLRSK